MRNKSENMRLRSEKRKELKPTRKLRDYLLSKLITPKLS